MILCVDAHYWLLRLEEWPVLLLYNVPLFNIQMAHLPGQLSTFPTVHQASEYNIILSKSRNSAGETDPPSLRSGSSNVRHVQQCRDMEHRGYLLFFELGIRVSRHFRLGQRYACCLWQAHLLPCAFRQLQLFLSEVQESKAQNQSLRKVEQEGRWICKCSWDFRQPLLSSSSNLCSPAAGRTDTGPGAPGQRLRCSTSPLLRAETPPCPTMMHTPLLSKVPVK